MTLKQITADSAVFKNSKNDCPTYSKTNFKMNLFSKLLQLMALIQLSQFVSTQNTSTAFNVTSTWMAGSSNITITQPVVYGTPGIASPTSDPGGRYGACSAASYIGLDTVYVFGGSSGSNIYCIFLFAVMILLSIFSGRLLLI